MNRRLLQPVMEILTSNVKVDIVHKARINVISLQIVATTVMKQKSFALLITGNVLYSQYIQAEHLQLDQFFVL